MIDANGVMVGTTPTPTMTARVGEEVVFTLRKSGFHPLKVSGTMTLASVNEPMTLYGELQVFSPPCHGGIVGGSPGQPVSTR